MDNKKMYKKIGSIFWWCLTILPLIIVLVQFIGYHLTFNSGISSASDLANYHSDSNGDFFVILNTYLNPLYNKFPSLGMSFLRNMYVDLFSNMGVTGSSNLATLFGYMTSIQFYHLLFDFIVWLPKWCHKLFDKVGD